MNWKLILLSASSLFVALILYVGFFGVKFQKNFQLKTHTSTENTFQFLTDPSYYPLWWESFIRHERIQGKPVKEGAQFYLFTEEEGEEFTLIETYLEVNKPEKVIREYQHDFYTLISKMEFSNTSEEFTEIQVTIQIRGSRFLENILLPLYAGPVLQEHMLNYERAVQVINNWYQ